MDEKPKMIYKGNIKEFAIFWSYFITCVGGKNVKFRSLNPDDGGEINLWAYLIFGMLTNCPGMDDALDVWNMANVIAQHDNDRPDNQLSETIKNALDHLENIIYDDKPLVLVMTFNRMVKSVIQPFFDVPEFNEMEEDDPYSVVRFLQKLHAKAWKYDNSTQSDQIEKIMDQSRSWNGGDSVQFTKHIDDLKGKIQTLPARLKPLHHMSITINSVIGSLARDQRLKSIHTFLRTKYDDKPDKVDLDYIVSRVTAELGDLDKDKRSTQKSEPSHEEGDPVATLTSCNFAKTNKHSHPPREKHPQTRSPISKPSRPPRISKCRIDPKIFEGLPQSEKDKIIKQNREIDAINEANGYRTNGYRPRQENRGARGQRHANGSRNEVDLTEMQVQDPLQCLMNEVDEEQMAKLGPNEASGDDAETTREEPVKPKILFTTEAKSAETAVPTTESSPNGPMPPDSGPSVSEPVDWKTCGRNFLALCSMFWILLTDIPRGAWDTFCSFLVTVCRWSSNPTLTHFCPSGTKQAAKSAAHCSWTQYFIHWGIICACLVVVFLILAGIAFMAQQMIGGSTAQAASANMRHLNASKSILTGRRIPSPFMSYQAAESMLAHKNGNWLFSFEFSALEAHAVTLPSADRDIELDWILDSGASCHFCNDSSKFISMRKCNVSISTAKKGESLLAIGIGDCMITTQSADGEKVKLLCRDTLYVPEARRNLLSASKLAKDNFQVILPTPNPVFPPGIYNCRKGKTSAAHAIPIVAIGTLFHIQTCAEEEVRRSDRIENKWICWHRRLGYMPLETLKNMIGSCQGLDDLQGVAMPRNYVSANVRMGKATNLDQPQQNPVRATKPMEIIHCDLFGPCKQPSFAGHTYCCVFVDDYSRYTWVYTIKQKSEFFDILKKFYADTAVIRNKHRFCCLRRDNAGENMSTAVKNWLTENGIKSENSTAHEPWQNGRAEVQIRVLCNIARTNMIASGLTGKFWARAIFYAADISNIQYRVDLKISPHQAVFGVKPDVSKCQPFGVECWLYVRADQRQDRKFDARGEPAIYCGRSTMDNKSSYVLYVPDRPGSAFVCTNNVVFGTKCPRAKDSPNVIDDGEVALDFPPEANDPEINSSAVQAIVDQTETHYILQMTDESVKSMAKPHFISTIIRTQNNDWTIKGAEIMNTVLLLDELSSLNPSSFFDAESVHFTDSAKHVDPKNYADAMSRSDAKQWKEAFDKEMDGLVQRKVFTVVDRPPDRNPLGTTMVWKYKVDNVNHTVTRKCRLCLRGDWQKEGVDFFKHKTFSAVLNCRENRLLFALAAANNWHIFSSDITQAFTYGKLDVPLYCYPPAGFDCPAGKVLGLNYCLYGAKQAPACFKSVVVALMIKLGFTAVNDAQTIWIKIVGKSILIHAIFVDDVFHCTNDVGMYREFRKKFEKEFELKANDHVDVYLGNHIVQDREKGTITVSQEHYVKACLEKFGLAQCNGSDTPMTERLSAKDQPATVDPKNQERYRGMVGSLLYLASWTRIDIAMAVSELSRFVSNPGEVHLEAAKRVFRYLKKTIHLGLTYRSSTSIPGQPDIPPNTLWGYVDSDWAGCPDSRKSTSAYVFMLNGAAISWRSKRQTTVALSTAEAEFISASAMVQEVIYLRKLLENLGFPQKEPTPA